ncbi:MULTISPECIES: hypothetical protein [unclassified Tolypothrix]|uniref:hypothetical protein n=1 Tax=unclassified Tolypothrix TaxID=2649714 RepID=UPI0005EABF47|nr:MULTISPECIES: hypothetical protein [unclassified Tolypothrix]BAY94953.1 hypothetical protein NIES3275_70080 [Microchaete diplosiphon NIES-3275]EKE97111.1 hypothetical protein FDUTEX481_06005 [Tolypothrix sp. PCC 7601]MBE9086718.1 hypothetical protein [Tolypothrix sp. LEGE 11397]UYD28590.1 hypothetical protein HGR01_11445 [Tolypothrix sp. PCC 7712]UYD35500.1 hypothetical protein HG267_06930 [Tolypothrix sp. PCC 7601]
MLRPVCHKTDQYRGYQQALDDFGIAEVLAKLSNYCQQQEQESLAALLISQLTQSIDAELIANYLSAMALNRQDLLPRLINQKFSPSSVDLPEDFPNTAKTPRFLYGDKLRWIGSDTDWGTAIGRFYSFAPHLCCWTWCYLICLSKDSPSTAWASADIAWEEDLEPLEAEPML